MNPTTGIDLSKADLSHANLNGADLRNANFALANLSAAYLWIVDLSGASFHRAKLVGADLSGATFDYKTDFDGAETDGCTVNRYQLERLNDYGSLTVGNRMSMNIIDDVAQLRASYSGFSQWVHLAALVLFLFPYVWFVLVQWSNAEFLIPDAEAHMPLWKALLTFIYNGGVNWQSGFAFHLSFIAFIFMACFNFLRAMLLWKTKQLELQQESSGLPAMFSLVSTRWGITLKVAKWSFFAYLAIGLLNVGHFFTQDVPINNAVRNIETVGGS